MTGSGDGTGHHGEVRLATTFFRTATRCRAASGSSVQARTISGASAPVIARTVSGARWPSAGRPACLLDRRVHLYLGRLSRQGLPERGTGVDGMRITCFATNTPHRPIAELELRHRLRARAEDRIRAARATGLRNLPLHHTAQNKV